MVLTRLLYRSVSGKQRQAFVIGARDSFFRHARAWPGHPRPCWTKQERRGWPGRSPAM